METREQTDPIRALGSRVLKSLMNSTLRPPFQNLSFKFDSPQPRMHTAQGPSHSMFTAHNVTIYGGVFNQDIAGEQRGE